MRFVYVGIGLSFAVLGIAFEAIEIASGKAHEWCADIALACEMRSWR
jgi:hypothetical protein